MAITSFQQNEEDYDPFKNRRLRNPTNIVETFFHFLKGVLGTAFLAMPWAFKNGGLIFSIIGLIFMGFICLHCNQILIESAHILYRRKRVPSLDYAGVAETSLTLGTENIRKYAQLFKAVVNILLVTYQFMTCCVYIIFITENIKQIIEYNIHQIHPMYWYIFTIFPFLLPLCMIRKLKLLAPISILANITMLIGIALILDIILRQEVNREDFERFEYVKDPSTWPLFFGTVVYALEGVGIIMSLENNMSNPTHFVGWPCSVINAGMFLLLILLVIVGFFGYYQFGNDVEASITLNFPTYEILPVVLKLTISFSIFLSYAIQFYVLVSIIWQYLKRLFPKMYDQVEYVLRFFLLLMTVGVASEVPQLNLFMPLIGSLCSSTLGIMFPAIIEAATYWEEPGFGKFEWRLWKDGFIGILGFIGCVTGVYTSIELKIINKSSDR